MRHVFEHREEARAKGQRAAADIRRSHSARKAGREMRDRLARVRALTPASERDASIDRLADRVAAGPRDGTRRRLPRRLLRSVLLRLMKPFTTFQRDVNAETVNALRHLTQQLEPVRAEQLRAETERLRQTRETEPLVHARMGVRELELPTEPSAQGDVFVIRNLLDAGMTIGDTNGHGNGSPVT
jgi:hypothetical protein